MSRITLRQLAETNAGSFTSASDAWNRVAAGLDTGLEEYITASQYLPAVWPTGDAAQQRNAALRAELSSTYEPCRKISSALRTHADTVLSLQGMLADIQRECVAAGLTVDLAAASVSSKNHLTDTTRAAQTAGLVQSYNQQLRELLTRARDLDRETAGALGQLPPPKPDSGRTGPKITKDDLTGLKGKTPQQVHDWWEGLTRDQREQAIHDFPREVGWMDGVPAVDRDKANRIGLAEDKQYLQDKLANAHSWIEKTKVEKELGRIETIENALRKVGSRGYLLGFDPTSFNDDGKLILAIGNPDTARHTGVWVPGYSTTLGSTDGNIKRMIDLNNAADQLDRSQRNDISTVYWLNYDAPDLDNMSVAHNDRSVAGRDPYLDFMQGLRATHDSDGGHLVAMGHSYGTTVVGEAAKTGRLPVDDIIVAGSPGMHAGSASELMADPRHVWAGAANDDPVADARTLSGGHLPGLSLPRDTAESLNLVHGLAPTDPDFGASRWEVDVHGHTHYWDNGTESLKNQARVLAGAYTKVTGIPDGQLPKDWQ